MKNIIVVVIIVFLAGCGQADKEKSSNTSLERDSITNDTLKQEKQNKQVDVDSIKESTQTNLHQKFDIGDDYQLLSRESSHYKWNDNTGIIIPKGSVVDAKGNVLEEFYINLEMVESISGIIRNGLHTVGEKGVLESYSMFKLSVATREGNRAKIKEGSSVFVEKMGDKRVSNHSEYKNFVLSNDKWVQEKDPDFIISWPKEYLIFDIDDYIRETLFFKRLIGHKRDLGLGFNFLFGKQVGDTYKNVFYLPYYSSGYDNMFESEQTNGTLISTNPFKIRLSRILDFYALTRVRSREQELEICNTQEVLDDLLQPYYEERTFKKADSIMTEILIGKWETMEGKRFNNISHLIDWIFEDCFAEAVNGSFYPKFKVYNGHLFTDHKKSKIIDFETFDEEPLAAQKTNYLIDQGYSLDEANELIALYISYQNEIEMREKSIETKKVLFRTAVNDASWYNIDRYLKNGNTTKQIKLISFNSLKGKFYQLLGSNRSVIPLNVDKTSQKLNVVTGIDSKLVFLPSGEKGGYTYEIEDFSKINGLSFEVMSKLDDISLLNKSAHNS